MVEELLECSIKKNSKNRSNTEFKVENFIKKESDKLYVKWKGYDNSFNSWIHKKDIVI